LWFTNSGNNSIGRITTTGTITNYTGTGISDPTEITAGPDGAMWFTNTGTGSVIANGSIGRISMTGVVTNYTDAGISSPSSITTGSDGALWFANGHNSIGRITTTGVVSDFSDPNTNYLWSITAGPDGALWFADLAGGIGRITTTGTVSEFTTNTSAPSSITAGPDGALWFTMDTDVIGRMTTIGVVTDYTDTSIESANSITTGPDGNLWFTALNGVGWITTAGVATLQGVSGLWEPQGIASGPDGAVWFANRGTDSIGRKVPGGSLTTFPSDEVYQPQDITTGPDGALWFTNGFSIGRVTTSGVLSDYPLTALPIGITSGPDGALWFTNGNNSIGRITTTGVVSNYTGTGIDGPFGIAAGPDGALWFTNLRGNSIGRITTTGVVTNYTGTGISEPSLIGPGPDGALWFTNRSGNFNGLLDGSIGRITTTGVVTNYTGTGIDSPFGIAAGPDGALWFTNVDNNSIGRITTAGVVTNYTSPSVNQPFGITAGADGSMWFANSGNDSIGWIATGSGIGTGGGPSISSVATPSATLGSRIFDTANLTNVTSNARGTISFRAFSDASCLHQTFSSARIQVHGPAVYPEPASTAASFSPTKSGTYYWIASYSGDGINRPVTGHCADPRETSVVSPPAPCSGVYVVGARGSGEPQYGGPYQGYGAEVWAALKAFTLFTQLGPVDAHALIYRADSTDILTNHGVPNRPGIAQFISSVNDGIVNLVLMVEDEQSACPTRPIVLLGYSQGALVVEQALVELQRSGSLAFGHVVGVGLIADPNRIGGTAYDYGSADSSFNGITQTLGLFPQALPSAVAGFTISYCEQGDLVCATGPALIKPTSPGSIHGAYARNGDATLVGEFVAENSGG